MKNMVSEVLKLGFTTKNKWDYHNMSKRAISFWSIEGLKL
jgi:hypothetical protein